MNYRKPYVPHIAYIDSLAIRGVKYVHTVHLGDVLETENAPFDYILKAKRLKRVKTIITHKAHPTNEKALGLIVRNHRKLLNSIKDYTSSYNSSYQDIKKWILKPSEVNFPSDLKNIKYCLRYQKDAENIIINEINLKDGQEDAFDEIVTQKTRYMNKLKSIHINGDSEDPNIIWDFLTNLNVNADKLTSLQKITLHSLNLDPEIDHEDLFSQIPEILTFIKQVQISFGDLNSTMLRFVESAQKFPNLERLSGITDLGSISNQFNDFQSLKDLEIYFIRGTEPETPGLILEILSNFTLPISLEKLHLQFAHLEAELINPFLDGNLCSFPDFLRNLPNLSEVNLTATINPGWRGQYVEGIFKLIKGLKTLKKINLELANALFLTKTEESFEFKKTFELLNDIIPSLEYLSLKVPSISFKEMTENQQRFTQLSELFLEGNDGIEHATEMRYLFQMLEPSVLKKLTLHEINIEEKDMQEHLNEIKRFTSLEKLELTYQGVEVGDELVKSFEDCC